MRFKNIKLAAYINLLILLQIDLASPQTTPPSNGRLREQFTQSESVQAMLRSLNYTPDMTAEMRLQLSKDVLSMSLGIAELETLIILAESSPVAHVIQYHSDYNDPLLTAAIKLLDRANMPSIAGALRQSAYLQRNRVAERIALITLRTANEPTLIAGLKCLLNISRSGKVDESLRTNVASPNTRLQEIYLRRRNRLSKIFERVVVDLGEISRSSEEMYRLRAEELNEIAVTISALNIWIESSIDVSALATTSQSQYLTARKRYTEVADLITALLDVADEQLQSMVDSDHNRLGSYIELLIRWYKAEIALGFEVRRPKKSYHGLASQHTVKYLINLLGREEARTGVKLQAAQALYEVLVYDPEPTSDAKRHPREYTASRARARQLLLEANPGQLFYELIDIAQRKIAELDMCLANPQEKRRGSIMQERAAMMKDLALILPTIEKVGAVLDVNIPSNKDALATQIAEASRATQAQATTAKEWQESIKHFAALYGALIRLHAQNLATLKAKSADAELTSTMKTEGYRLTVSALRVLFSDRPKQQGYSVALNEFIQWSKLTAKEVTALLYAASLATEAELSNREAVKLVIRRLRMRNMNAGSPKLYPVPTSMQEASLALLKQLDPSNQEPKRGGKQGHNDLLLLSQLMTSMETDGNPSLPPQSTSSLVRGYLESITPYLLERAPMLRASLTPTNLGIR